MKLTINDYINTITEKFIFKPKLNELNLNNIGDLKNFNGYICKFKIKKYSYNFMINLTKKNCYSIIFKNGLINKVSSRPILKNNDCQKFIYQKLLNLFSDVYNKNYIDFDMIEFE
jgi:hypothetical protein